MAALRYCTPFAFLALLPLGAWLGGGWTLAPAIATPLALTSLDAAFGDEHEPAGAGAGPAHRLILWLYIPLQLAAFAWAAAVAARPATSLAEAAGLALSAGVTLGVFGFVAAHDMIHSRSRAERALGLALLGAVFYMHFRIAHVHGHHRRAATWRDPASARLGESLYAFLPRSIVGQFAEAWGFEADRLRRAGRAAVGPGNRVLGYLALEAGLLLVLGLVSLRALAFVAATALIAVALLESFNYVAHYGLTRRLAASGRPEPLGPQHSWNSARRMNNAALFNMGRHSDHHRLTQRPYQALEPLPGAAELPAGYAGALLTALIPPLWRRMMDPRARTAMERAMGIEPTTFSLGS
ncbi:alkane 1-monooxygenase [Phenylobacterium sp.]|uniref:alkane 1-monooxygenase n=1 Tax=Phenylobacterium sp. TaxID=1871053 RepID=UPI0039C98E42